MKKIKNLWKTFHYNTDALFLLDENIIKLSINKFYDDVIKKSKAKNFHILYRIKDYSDNILTLTYKLQTNKKDLNNLIEAVIEYWNIKDGYYKSLEIKEIIISYKEDFINKKELPSHLPKPRENYQLDKVDINNFKHFKIQGWSLPNTLDITQWGTIIYQSNRFYIIQKSDSKAIYYITLHDYHLEVELKLSNKTLFKWRDELIKSERSINSFVRYINNQTYYFIDGELELKTKTHNIKFFEKIKPAKDIDERILTMDLETRAINNNFQPYCITIYDGIKAVKTFYLHDYKNIQEMLEKSIKFIYIQKYNNYKVFFHNFSYFDATFLLKTISKFSIGIKPVMRNGKFINLKVYYGTKSTKYKIEFRDSILLLPVSLRELSKSFGTENKGIFPYKFVNNENIKLDYTGKVPKYNKFEEKDVSFKDYVTYFKEFIGKVWDLKNETIKYAELDTIILHKILNIFNEQIFGKYRISILKYPTISSLAFAIYRLHYLIENKIAIIQGKIYNDLKLSYTGGSVDVYRPFGRNIRGYDVNSLYPFVMANFDMPVGKPIEFEGNINILHPDQIPFRFHYVEVIAPQNLYVPVLQIKLKDKGVYKTITPVGTWKGFYFSEELKYAITLGYKIKIISGYLFEKENLFNKIINDLYINKKNSERGSALYLIYKLLMNSLYGRFGMNPLMEETVIAQNQEEIDFYYDSSKFVVKDAIELDNGKELISYLTKEKYEMKEDAQSNAIVSIPIASAITAYARIHMAKLKNELKDHLYYSDTDSIYVDIDLSKDPRFSHLIHDNELGKLKLEQIFIKAIFLAPKMYGGIYRDKKTGLLTNYMKIKGVKSPLKFKEMYNLLYKDQTIKFNQEKWYRDINNSTINIKEIIHTLKLSNSKRELIYENNKFINTKPININIQN